MTCIKCGQKHTSVPREMEMEGHLKGESLTVRIVGTQCPHCSHRSIEGSQMAEFMGKVADAYRVKRGLLTAGEIRRARERLSMSQVEFAAYVGAGQATIKRAEHGEIQSKAIDELIRLKTDPDYMATVMTAMYERLAANQTVVRQALAACRRAPSANAGLNCEQELAA